MFMNPDAEYVMMNEVRRDEKLLWAGRPTAGFVLTPVEAFMTIFGLAWTAVPLGMLLALASGEFEKGEEAPPLLIMGPFLGVFILIGLYMLVGRHVVAVRKRKRTFYGLTTERAIIKTSRETASFPLRNLQHISLTEKRDGRGTIMLAQPNPAAAYMPAGHAPSFDVIPDAREVYQLIQQAIRASTCSTGS